MDHAEYMRAYRANPENAAKHREISKRWRERNRVQHRAYQRSWKEAHPGYREKWTPEKAERQRERQWLSRYGITKADVAMIIAEQGGGCAICLTPLDLVLDHDHETGRFRAVLCRGCNVSLGYLERGLNSRIRNDPDQLARARQLLGGTP